MTFRTRIALTYIVLVIAGVALVSLLSSWQIQKYLENRTLLVLHEELDTFASLFAGGQLHVDSTGHDDDTLVHLARTLKLRLTVIRKDGTVMFDSEVPRDSLVRLENHAQRPEIVNARTGGMGTDRRKSASVDEDFLYAAQRIDGTGELDSAYVRTALRLDEIAEINTRVQGIIWGVGLLAAILSAVISYQAARRLTRPILSMAASAQKIKDGDLAERIPVVSDDEIGALARAINEMAEKLSTDIIQLRKLERMRSEFLGNVSHELRTPIFSIQGFVETLLDGAVDDPSVNRDFLEKVLRQSTRLNSLLNDLIEISRIESGEMKMSFRYVGVGELLRSTTEELAGAADRKHIVLRVESDVPNGERVYGDRERLRQALYNLVDNAIKYTDEGGRVTVGARNQTESVTIYVEDTGCGIAPEHQPRIFERFYRVDRDRSREVGGTGLGLAIVKHIVEAHGSHVSVASTVGQGSTFSFSLRK